MYKYFAHLSEILLVHLITYGDHLSVVSPGVIFVERRIREMSQVCNIYESEKLSFGSKPCRSKPCMDPLCRSQVEEGGAIMIGVASVGFKHPFWNGLENNSNCTG